MGISTSGATGIIVPSSYPSGAATTTALTTITASNGSKSAYSAVIVSTTSAIETIVSLQVEFVANGNVGFVDIATGAAGSETILFKDLFISDYPGVSGNALQVHTFLVSIPASTRIAARAQSNGAGQNVRVALQGA